jgi:hypothetical protein
VHSNLLALILSMEVKEYCPTAPSQLELNFNLSQIYKPNWMKFIDKDG